MAFAAVTDALEMVLNHLDHDALLSISQVSTEWSRCIEELLAQRRVLPLDWNVVPWGAAASTDFAQRMAEDDEKALHFVDPAGGTMHARVHQQVERLAPRLGEFGGMTLVTWFGERSIHRFPIAVFSNGLAVFDESERVVQLVRTPPGLVGVDCLVVDKELLVKCRARSGIPPARFETRDRLVRTANRKRGQLAPESRCGDRPGFRADHGGAEVKLSSARSVVRSGALAGPVITGPSPISRPRWSCISLAGAEFVCYLHTARAAEW